MLFCGMCGTRLARVCSNCGFANPADYRFCGMCGTRLLVDAEAATIIPALPEGVSAAPLTLPLPELISESGRPDSLTTDRRPQVTLEGERRVATVVVTDMSGSTALLERVGTEAWVELMNRILHILEAEVERFGGEVEQFRGDGLVAFFGATNAHEDDPERAVLAALSMQQALTLCSDEVNRYGDLKLRVGVDTGEVIVTAQDERRPYSEMAMGMAIAVAARMESAAEPGTALASENTYKLVEAQFEWQALGEISVRGISQPIAVYRPLAQKSDGDGRYSLRELQHSTATAMIGREAEFRELKHCVQDVFAGRGRIVSLTGDKGIGKSFLVNELRQYFLHRGALLARARAESATADGSAPDLTWLRGRCRSYHEGWPFSMWIDLLQDWLGAHHVQAKEDVRSRLRSQTETLWGDEFIEFYPYLATLMSLPLEAEFQERVRHLDGEGLRQRYVLAIRSWLEALCKRGPLVIAFADMQWAGVSSLNLLRHCLSLCDTQPLVCLLVYRPERASPIWEFQHYVESEYPHRFTYVELAPLSDEQSEELIASLIGRDTLPADTRDLIVKNAAGNPYYILELIRSLITGGVLARDEQTGRWRATRVVTTLDLPSNLQRLLGARIDRLSSDERFVLQVASVIGSAFWSNVIQAVMGGMAPITSHLIASQRADLIQEIGRVPELGMQYLFKSPLIRDAAYESLLTAQRVTVHLKVAEYLEFNVSADALVGYYGLLAHHYRYAERDRKELFYTLLAAEQARKVYANAEAIQRYARALELLDRMEADAHSEERLHTVHAQRFEVLKERREILMDMGDVEAAAADARTLLALARDMSDDPAWMIDALLSQLEVSTGEESRESVMEGLKLAQQALALSQQIGDRNREMLSLIAVAWMSHDLRKPEARELAERALDLAQQLGDLRTEVNLLLSMGMSYGMDDLPRSQEYLHKALARSEKLNDKATEMSLLGAISPQFERLGDYHRQLTEYELKRLRIAQQIGHRWAEGQALNFCGQIQGIYLGDFEAGLAMEQEALRKWEQIASKLFPMLRIAQMQVMQGQLGAARATLEQAQPISGHILNELGRAGQSLVTAILYTALADEAHLGMALDLTSQVQQMVADNLISRQYRMAAACYASTAHLRLARLLSGGDTVEAERQPVVSERERHLQLALESSQTALGLYRDFGFTQIVECTGEEILFRHSEVLAAHGRAAEAATYLTQAYDEMMRKHDFIPPDSHFRKTYLDIALHREIRSAYEVQQIELSSASTA
jgi:predicted ATPase/class 3 adenylate cyclase